MNMLFLIITMSFHARVSQAIVQIELHQNLVNRREHQSRLLNARYQVPLDISQNLYYHMSLELGTPGQFLRIMIDTGSDKFWVGSPTSVGCGENRNKFDSGMSSTFVNLDSVGYIQYISAKVEGNVGRDLASLGQIREETEVIVAQKCTNIDKIGTYDGIMGFTSSRKISNIFDLAYQRGQLVSSKFALDLNNLRGNTPSLMFNISETDFPTVYYLKNAVPNYWSVNLTGVYFDETLYPIKLGFIDTGAPYLHFPTVHFKKIYDQFFKQSCKLEKRILCSCSQKLKQYPTVSIENARSRFLMTPRMYMQRTQDNVCELKMKMINLTKEPNAMLLGSLFLKYYTVIYDKANNQIGFVPLPIIEDQDYITNQEVLNVFNVLAGFGTAVCVIIFVGTLCTYRGEALKESLNEQVQVEMSSENERNPQIAQNQQQIAGRTA